MRAKPHLLVCWVAIVGCGEIKGTPDAPPATCTPDCRPGFACVEGSCVSECNPACDQGFTCTAGNCVEDCTPGEVRCDSACIDPLTDSMHCGAKGSCAGSDSTAADFAGAVCGSTACVAGACEVSGLVISAATMNYNVFIAAGSPTAPVQLNVRVATGIKVGSISPLMPAFTTGALPAGSTVTLVVDGQIVGAGGAGGSGGNGGGGGNPAPCGRPGGPGGTALVLTVPTTITNNGLIAGGGGGGGGMSGCTINAGGGGGAGASVGVGGAAASLATGVAAPAASETAFCGQDNGTRTGTAGAVGGATTGGAGGDPAASGAGGRGGDLGRVGLAALSCISDTVGGNGAGPGGAAGFAIRRGTQTITIADGTYATGAGPIRGPVGP